MLPRTLKIVFAHALMLAAVFAFWYAAGRPRGVGAPALSADHRLPSVSYAPFEKDQSPLEAGSKGLVISEQRIDADLAILARRFDCIRTYSVAGLEAIPRYAEKYGLKVLLGAWVSADPVLTRKELATVVEIAKRHPSCVRAIVVGNEALLRGEVTGAQLAGYIRQVKAALPEMPVTYADVWEFWLKHPEVAPAVDFVMIHILPYWEDDPVSIEESMAHVRKIRQELARKLQGKQIVIGETGWPSQGRMRAGALPSPVNQARFMRGFVAMAEQEQWPYNLIEAFDQPWKRVKEGAVGGYWGLYDANRRIKPVFDGPVSNYPNWATLFGLSAAIVLLTLPITGRRLAMRRSQWLSFSALAATGAVLIVLQGHQFWTITRNFWEALWALMVLVQAAVVYFSVLWAVALDRWPEQLPLKSSMDLLRDRLGRKARRLPSPASSGWMSAVISVNRLAVLAFALIAATSLLFDARYRSFNNCGFLLCGLGYAWLWRRQARAAGNGALERLVALVLAAMAVGIWINETPLNWQADLWGGACLLLAYPLWKAGRGSSIRPLLGYGLGLLAAYAVFAALRHFALDSAMVASLCEENAAGGLCVIRSVLGKLMYHQVFGWTSLGLAGLALWRNNARLCLLAMIAGLGSFAFYNVSLGAIAFVPTGLALAHQKLSADGAIGAGSA